jgi:hypothetical protein
MRNSITIKLNIKDIEMLNKIIKAIYQNEKSLRYATERNNLIVLFWK